MSRVRQVFLLLRILARSSDIRHHDVVGLHENDDSCTTSLSYDTFSKHTALAQY